MQILCPGELVIIKLFFSPNVATCCLTYDVVDQSTTCWTESDSDTSHLIIHVRSSFGIKSRNLLKNPSFSEPRLTYLNVLCSINCLTSHTVMHIESFKMRYSSDNQSIFWFKSKTEKMLFYWMSGGKKPHPFMSIIKISRWYEFTFVFLGYFLYWLMCTIKISKLSRN